MKTCRYLLITLLIAHGSLYSISNRSFMTYRSQGFNLARMNSWWTDRCCTNNASLAVEYTQSFDRRAINNYFFGCNEIAFSGSRVADRGRCDILADYFGLPTDFKSVISFSPRVQNVIMNADLYWQLPCNFNLRINAPLVYSKWALNPCERVIEQGTSDYPAGYMGNRIIKRAQLENGALDVLTGKSVFGDLAHPLNHGRISRCELSKTKVADVLVALGYNVACCPCGMFDINIHMVIPTGTRSKAYCLFEPQIGNGHHWALGGGFSAQYDFVDCDDCKLSACVDACAQHLFESRQKRTYDLKPNGAGSRYMLLMDMIGMFSINQGFSSTPGTELLDKQYSTRLLYAADATTLDSSIKIDVQADVVAKLLATYRCWNVELGYEFWGRTREKLVDRKKLNHRYYGIKGDAQVDGFIDIGGGFILSLPLNATQSHATLYAPQPDGNTTHNFVNSNADNPALMFNIGFLPIAQTTPASLVNTGATVLEQVNGSDQAIALRDNDIDDCSGLSPQAHSNKIFGSIMYQYETCRTQPYVAIGAEGEFADKINCLKTAISQWGVWVKGGLNY